MDKATQRSLILAYCATNGSITVREAFEGLNINSPTKRISEIRKSGEYKVHTETESRTDENGITKRWNRYFITPLSEGERVCR